jgi:hypothetical protein
VGSSRRSHIATSPLAHSSPGADELSSRRRHSGPSLRARWTKVDPALRARGHAGNGRLNARWRTFIERGKNPIVANVAVARELSGWCWSLATMQ